MRITAKMYECMAVLEISLRECLDDDYPDMIARVMYDYDFTDEEYDFCVDNYWEYV